MNITVDHKKFKDILELVARVSMKHLTLPILQCVLLEVKNGTLIIKATNLEIGIEGTLEVKEKEEGIVAVPAHTLLSIVSLITQKEVTLKKEGDTLIVTNGNSESKINIVSGDDFPKIPTISKNGQKINGNIFALGVKTAAFAASASSIKPELGSIYIYQKKPHTLTYVATDSFRLMEKTIPQQGVTLQDSILVPQKNALELARVCDVLEEEPTLFVTENQCALQFEHIYITSRLTSGTFPDYEQIIPKEYGVHATLLTKDLMQALKKTNIFLNKFMQLTVTVDKKGLTLQSGSGELGTTTEHIHASVEGNELTLNFNQRYIAEALQYIVDDSLTLHFAGIGRPVVLESVHDRSIRYLVMPMNK